MARKSGKTAEIWFIDEGRFGLKLCMGRMWCRKDLRPFAQANPGYRNFYLFSAVNPKTCEEFSLQLPPVDTGMMSLYLKYLRRQRPGVSIILVLDGAGWHKAKDLVIPKGVELVYLPTYSPELNPVERLWQWLRRHVCRNRLFKSLDELEAALIVAWRSLDTSLLLSLCKRKYL